VRTTARPHNPSGEILLTVEQSDRDTETSRVWLITGASSGFGRALAEAVLANGDAVVGVSRTRGGLDELAANYPDRLAIATFDITDSAGVTGSVQAAISRFGRIDVLVNNAGRAVVGAVEETTDRELRDLMELHFFAPVALVRGVLPHMRERGSGAIVQISSMGGRTSFPGVGAYSAGKFALEGISEALAGEVAGLGIKVLIVEPGAFRTGLQSAGSMRHTMTIAAYDDVVGPVRQALINVDGNQPGDPAKAAAAIIAALDDEDAPLRMPLGNDAMNALGRSVEQSREGLAYWEPVARNLEFDA
jgi:NAD(P)-dependent dehydrogenase (short-subunit alcohol dehydrogenase family)